MLRSVNLQDIESDYSIKYVKSAYDGFKVKLNGRNAVCYKSRCSKIPFNKMFDDERQRDIGQTEILGHISFEADEDVFVEVESAKPFSRASVRPLSKGVSVTADGHKISFTLKNHGQYSLELDDEHNCLCLFFNPINDFGGKDYYTHYFGAGNHFVGVLNLKSGDRVYVDKDAVLFGGIYAKDAENIVVEGYGTIDGSVLRRVDTGFFNRGNLMFENCRNIKISGPILLDSAFWVASFFNCRDVAVDNVKITGQWRFNTDGIDLVNCRDVVIKNSFLHTFDDTVAVKAYSQFKDVTVETVENITVENCVMWCNWGRTIEIGIETVAKEYKNIRFSHCDLIHNSAAAIDIQNGNCALIRDIAIKNINVEFQTSAMPEIYQSSYGMQYDGYGKIWMPYLISIDNHKYAKYVYTEKEMAILNAYTDDTKEFGTVKDVIIDNVRIYAENGLPRFKIKIRSEDESAAFDNITVSNVSVNGKPATADAFDLYIDDRIKNLTLSL